MRTMLFVLVFGALVSLTLDAPRRVATTLLRDAQSVLGAFGADRHEWSDGWADMADVASRAAASVELPPAGKGDTTAGTAEPTPGASAPLGAEAPRPPAVALASPAQRPDIAGTAPGSAPDTIEPIASQTPIPPVPMDLPAEEGLDTGLPETLSVPSSAREVTRAEATDAIALASVGLPPAGKGDTTAGTAEPTPGASAPLGAEVPRPPAVALASPAQRPDIAGTAPGSAPDTIEPVPLQTPIPPVPMDLPAGEGLDTELPETLSGPSSAGDLTRAEVTDAIALYRAARDLLWDLD